VLAAVEVPLCAACRVLRIVRRSIIIKYDWRLSGQPTRAMSACHTWTLVPATFYCNDSVCLRTNHFLDGEVVCRHPHLFGPVNLPDLHLVYFGEAFRFLFRPSKQLLEIQETLRRRTRLPATNDWTAIHFTHGRDQFSSPVIRVSPKHVENAVFADLTAHHVDFDSDPSQMHAWGEFLLLSHARFVVRILMLGVSLNRRLRQEAMFRAVASLRRRNATYDGRSQAIHGNRQLLAGECPATPS